MMDASERANRLSLLFGLLGTICLIAFLVVFFRNGAQMNPVSGVLLLLVAACFIVHMAFRVRRLSDEGKRRRCLALGIIAAICIAASFPLRQYVFVGWPASIAADLIGLAGIALMVIYEGTFQTGKAA